MKNIIVTVRNEEREYSYDIEIPVDLEGGKLLDDLIQTLNGYDPSLYLQSVHSEIICDKTGAVMEENQTPEDLGIRNGDFITIRRKVQNHATDNT